MKQAKKCKIYKDDKLTQFLIEIEKGELVGGKKENKSTKVIELIEPIKGFIASKYVKVCTQIITMYHKLINLF